MSNTITFVVAILLLFGLPFIFGAWSKHSYDNMTTSKISPWHVFRSKIDNENIKIKEDGLFGRKK